MIFYFIRFKKYSIIEWFSILIIVHITFEVIEFILALGGNPLFVEEFIDIIWDVIWSLIGFGLMWLFKNEKNKIIKTKW